MRRRNFVKKEEAIKLLKEGWEIYTNRSHYTGSKGQTIYDSLTFIITSPPPSNQDRNVHHSTITALKRSKIIHDKAPYHLINN